jgi:hypothetical protein
MAWISRKSMIRSTAARCSSSWRLAGPQYTAVEERKFPRILRRVHVMMLSSTLMPLNRATFWKVRAMPRAATSKGLRRVRSFPWKENAPFLRVIEAAHGVEQSSSSPLRWGR